MFVRTLHHVAALALIMCAVAGPLAAEESQESVAAQLKALSDRVGRQEAELQQLRAALNDKTSDERRTAEVRAAVKQALADPDLKLRSASSLQAGYKDGFFIAAEDQSFSLRINVEGQFRYIFDNAEHQPAPNPGDDVSGFQLRRARLDFTGNAINPQLTYRLQPAYDRATGNLQLDDAWVAYAFTPGLRLKGGQFKPYFLREENVGAFVQLAAERSYLADYFTIDFTQGAELTYDIGQLHLAFTVHDGSYAANTDYTGDRSVFALSGRAEYVLAGEWKQFRDFTSWPKEPFSLMIGAGADYEQGQHGPGTNTPNIFKYTADVSAELGGANLFAAIVGQQFSDDDNPAVGGLPTNLNGAHQFGFVAQGGAFVIPNKLEPFVRYEWINFDGVYYRNNGGAFQNGSRNLTEDNLSIVTVGANYYFEKHKAKLTVDLLYALDPVPVSNTGGGLVRNDKENELALRCQFQFRF
jgi:hypothetical protein